ncbi:hypothetical protein HZH66_002966 [Vespula vulgaris]|uniref:Uncharacterized protein n=1 Tax=Vespula vulgaris TaxID=7454 RepID=A0A834KI59_VESVU|nr:hypothetical protein HZH66_002966 [Vespula vulgaris]
MQNISPRNICSSIRSVSVSTDGGDGKAHRRRISRASSSGRVGSIIFQHSSSEAWVNAIVVAVNLRYYLPVAKGPKVENGDGNFSFRLRSRKVEKEGFPESQDFEKVIERYYDDEEDDEDSPGNSGYCKKKKGENNEEHAARFTTKISSDRDSPVGDTFSVGKITEIANSYAKLTDFEKEDSELGDWINFLKEDAATITTTRRILYRKHRWKEVPP